jgi:hypothetical protein
LFEKNIDNYQSWSRQIEDSKAGFARGVENSQGLGDLVVMISYNRKKIG